MNMTVNFDTVTKAGTVTLDGEAVPDVSRVELYHVGGGRFQMEIYCRSADPATGVNRMTCVTASADGSASRREVPDVPDLTPELARAVAARYKPKR